MQFHCTFQRPEVEAQYALTGKAMNAILGGLISRLPRTTL